MDVSGVEMILAFFVCVGLTFIAMWLAIKVTNLQATIQQRDRTIRLMKMPIKDHEHAARWNYLWAVIRDNFNIFKYDDGSWCGGQSAKEILKMLRSEYGSFNSEQIEFITQLVIQIRKVQENQKERELALNPADKEIEFDEEGGFHVVKKFKPSAN